MSISKTKIWGSNTEIFVNDYLSVNFMNVLKNSFCSRHIHRQKYNLFYVISGVLEIRIFKSDSDDIFPQCIKLEPGKSFLIKPYVRHLFHGIEDCKVIEIMFTRYDPEDIYREVLGYKEE